MNEKTSKEQKLLASALTLPKHEDFMIEKFRENPELALGCVQDEFQEYY